MRLLHTGDLHLDSAFCAYGKRDAEDQRESGRRLLRRIFDTAREESCDMVLIAGDLFDGRFVTPETEALFYELVENAHIPIVISPGNHDFYTDNSFYGKVREKLGDALTLFCSNELQMFEFDDLQVRVFGYAFTSAVLSENPLLQAQLPEDDRYINIFCGHADLAAVVSRYAPITASQLIARGFDYAALGHIHNRPECEDTDGRVRYCGFAQGRSFDEIGEGGVWIVDVERDSCRAERKKLSERAFFIADIDIGDADGFASAEEIVRREVEKYACAKGVSLRVILSGRAEDSVVSYLQSKREEIAGECGIEYLEILDRTLPYIDGEYLERDTTLRGELYRTLLPRLTSDDASERYLAVRALRIGIAAIDGKSVFDASDREGGKA